MAAAQPPARPKTIIIGISGPSSSGKTTLARLLREVFAIEGNLRSFIIHEDDFYYPDDKYALFRKISISSFGCSR